MKKEQTMLQSVSADDIDFKTENYEIVVFLIE